MKSGRAAIAYILLGLLPACSPSAVDRDVAMPAAAIRDGVARDLGKIASITKQFGLEARIDRSAQDALDMGFVGGGADLAHIRYRFSDAGEGRSHVEAMFTRDDALIRRMRRDGTLGAEQRDMIYAMQDHFTVDAVDRLVAREAAYHGRPVPKGHARLNGDESIAAILGAMRETRATMRQIEDVRDHGGTTVRREEPIRNDVN